MRWLLLLAILSLGACSQAPQKADLTPFPTTIVEKPVTVIVERTVEVTRIVQQTVIVQVPATQPTVDPAVAAAQAAIARSILQSYGTPAATVSLEGCDRRQFVQNVQVLLGELDQANQLPATLNTDALYARLAQNGRLTSAFDKLETPSCTQNAKQLIQNYISELQTLYSDVLNKQSTTALSLQGERVAKARQQLDAELARLK